VPPHAVFCDLHYDSRVGELRSDCVGGFEVTGTSGRFHLGNFLFDVGVGEFCRPNHLSQFVADIFLASLSQRPIEDLLRLGSIIIVEHRKNLVKSGERVQQRRDIILLYLAGVKGSIGPANHIEDRSLRLRGIKVVVQRPSHSLYRTVGKGLHIVPGSVRKRPRGQT